eukprot:7902474-Karenia_brevis.AAC.1
MDISSSNGATRCHYPPFSQAEMAALMAALKLIRRREQVTWTSHRAMVPHAATAHPSCKLKWLH